MTSETTIYGIDLGTTYSVLAAIDEDDRVEIVPNSENEQTTPSVVQFESPNNVVVGSTAKDAKATHPDSVVENIKRQMGTAFTFDVYGRRYTPEEISALILKKIVQDAKQKGREVKDVVVACPAYFGDKERKATRKACELAGLNVLWILDEPIAGLLGYIDDFQQERNALVYDLGGGTFDVAVVKIKDACASIVSVEGDHRLGGCDWDASVARILISEFQEIEKIDDQRENEYHRLHEKAEKAKRKLSKREKDNVQIEHSSGRCRQVAVTRKTFEESTSDLLERTIDLTKEAIAKARAKGVYKIDQILLVGGSTKMPMVLARLKEELEGPLQCEIVSREVEYMVAKGAALFGKIQQERSLRVENYLNDAEERVKKPVSIQMVATKSYGIKATNNGIPVVNNLIIRQTPTPIRVSKSFGIAIPGAKQIELEIYYSDKEEDFVPIEDCEIMSLIRFALPPDLPYPAQLNVAFNLSEEGDLQIEATETSTGKTVNLLIEMEGAMTDEELNAARKLIASLEIE